MAVRLALLAHHYRSGWDWTDAGLADAQARLGRWRRAVAAPAAPSAEPVLALVRARIADDLDAPGALAAVDKWADAVLGGAPAQSWDPDAPMLVRETVDAILGVAF